jgi:hypothetical protein
LPVGWIPEKTRFFTGLLVIAVNVSDFTVCPVSTGMLFSFVA